MEMEEYIEFWLKGAEHDLAAEKEIYKCLKSMIKIKDSIYAFAHELEKSIRIKELYPFWQLCQRY